MNGPGELDLPGGQISVRIVGHLLPQDQDAVQRRAKLMGHVGQELGFVFRGERQFRGFLLHRAARLIDFLVLAFDFDVLLRELARLLLQLLIGLLQLFLLRLEFARQANEQLDREGWQPRP